MDLTPYIDNEKISFLLRAVHSKDQEWIEDAARIARDEPRLERVVDQILADSGNTPTERPKRSKPDGEGDGDASTGTKGGEAHTPPPHPKEEAPSRRQ